jgi:hypothetical protein
MSTQHSFAAAGHPLRAAHRVRPAEPRQRAWRTPSRARLPFRETAKMAFTGTFLGLVFYAGTLGWAHESLAARTQPRLVQASPTVATGSDPYVESRLSRAILDQQSGRPAAEVRR